MNKVGTIAFVLTFTWFCLGIASGGESIDRPVSQEGERWEFKANTKDMLTSTTDILDGKYEVVFLHGQLEVFQIVDGQKVGASLGVAEKLKRLIAIGQDDLQLLIFPLSVGKKWTANYQHTSPGARRSQLRSATFQVEKLEQIKVDAGTFQAVRIKGTGGNYGVTREWNYHYSPDTKSIVKFFYDSGIGTKSGKTEIELMKYHPSGR